MFYFILCLFCSSDGGPHFHRMLIRLRGIREAMLTSAADGSGVTGGKDVRKLREENDDLKKKCQKYEYRIMHLVRNLEAAMEKIGSN